MHPALLMFVAHRYAEERILKAVREAGHQLTLAQARVGARIAEDGIRLTDLAAQAQITKQSAGALVDQLEAAGYVERVRDPSDSRARLVRLSDQGRAARRLARREEQRIRREWTEHLGSARMEALEDALTSLREITDPWA